MSRLKAPVVRLTKQKIISGTIADVLGPLCSVRLSGRGITLHSLKYIGPQPAKGDSVYVDYRSGVPVVLTNSSNLEKAVAELRELIEAENDAVVTVPDQPPDVMPGTDAVRRFIVDTDPTVTDDVDAGYEVSDLWLNIDTGGVFICLDITTGAALWLLLGTFAGISIVWGIITGDITDQADLQAALDAKSNAGHTHLYLPSDADYSDISANDAATDVTGAELEELTDGSETVLHTHPGGGLALKIVMDPTLSDPPVPVLTPEGDDYVYYEVSL